ncbi:MAG: flagellar export protein FliJ [Spirochaetaceae bacterium]|nr:flagellar export protein FliJ [Spirochaetaceae bacterium]
MKQFSFSLEKILDLRKFEKKQAEAELGKALSEEKRIQDQLDDIASERVSTNNDSDSVHDIFNLMRNQQYLSLLKIREEQYLNDLAQAKIVSEGKRNELIEAMKKEKVLTKLKEAKLREYNKNLNKQEDISNDDVVTARYGR